MNKNIIELKEVFKVYHPGQPSEVRALAGVSVQIEQGEFVAVLGSSGSGKSTMMNILGCLDMPSYGDYILDGKPVGEYTDKELSRIRNIKIGFIFQGYNLISDLSAMENVELPLIYRGINSRGKRDRLAKEALAKVGLSDRIKHRPNEMSGGQQQRVAIARAISTSPPIIMADEPTGNLDTKSGMEVMNILEKLHQSGTTVILITHDNEIAKMAKRTIKLKDGLILSDTKYAVEG